MKINKLPHWIYPWLAWIWLCLSSIYYSYMAAGFLSISVAIGVISIFVEFFLVGELFVKFALDNNERFNNISTRLLTGTLLSSVIFFIAALVLPFGLIIDWTIILSVSSLIWYKARKKRPNRPIRNHGSAECVFLLLATVVVMAWCLDILRPIASSGEVAVIRAWQDVYYHLAYISSLARSKGLGSMYDLQMAGTPAHPYHIAIYLFAALLSSIANGLVLPLYAGFLVPFGILLTALAAYSLASSVFGKWPGLAAGLSVLLLPDAFQQGFGNQFSGGYYWLQQIAPGGNFGVACASVAFMLLFEGCRTTRYRFIALGYLFVLFTLIFKAQIFVAISFLAFIFPVLFKNRFNLRYRIVLALALIAIYVLVVELSQLSQNVPTMRLDGTGLFPYSSTILANQIEGVIREFGIWAFTASGNNWALRASAFVIILSIVTFGIFPFIYIAFIFKLRKSHDQAVWLFPVLVIAMYLLMATSLALDDRHLGSPEELLHRPFVWAYFVLVVWCSAGAYKSIFGDAIPASLHAKLFVICLIFGLLSTPFIHSKRIQTIKQWQMGYQELPVCQQKVAQFIRENSELHATVQDSLNDPRFILSGLSERQAFAIDTKGTRSPIGIKHRLASLESLKNSDEASQVELFMRQNAIDLYVTNPGEKIRWKEALVSRVVFHCGDYDVYHF